MAECPKCGHVYKDPTKVKGGKVSKRKDMGKGSEGQRKAQEGRKKGKAGEGKASTMKITSRVSGLVERLVMCAFSFLQLVYYGILAKIAPIIPPVISQIKFIKFLKSTPKKLFSCANLDQFARAIAPFGVIDVALCFDSAGVISTTSLVNSCSRNNSRTTRRSWSLNPSISIDPELNRFNISIYVFNEICGILVWVIGLPVIYVMVKFINGLYT